MLTFESARQQALHRRQTVTVECDTALHSCTSSLWGVKDYFSTAVLYCRVTLHYLGDALQFLVLATTHSRGLCLLRHSHNAAPVGQGLTHAHTRVGLLDALASHG